MPIFQPLLTIQTIAPVEGLLGNYSAIVVTSANAIPSLHQGGARSDAPIYAVGPETAAAAKTFGFRVVHAAEGTAENLISMVRQHRSPKDGTIIYASGSHITQDVAAELSFFGYPARRLIVYTASPHTELSASTLSALRERRLHSVVLMSRRTAEIFRQIIRQRQLEGTLHAVTAFALSQKVASVIYTMPWKDVRVAQVPTRTGMLALMQQAS